jgi:hypothetical protein
MIFRVRAHAGEVAAGIGFGHGDGENAFTLHAARQKTLALFGAAEARQVGPHETAVQRVVPVADARVLGFLEDHLLEAEVVVPHAAVLLIRPHHQVTLFTGLQESFASDDALFAPALHVRHDLGGQKAAIGRAKHDLFFGEVAGQHAMGLQEQWRRQEDNRLTPVVHHRRGQSRAKPRDSHRPMVRGQAERPGAFCRRP